MRKIMLLVSSAAILGATTVTVPAQAATSVKVCRAHKVAHRSYWTCITPGSYCAVAAHNHYGYAKVTSRRYKCLRYTNGQWRWKRA